MGDGKQSTLSSVCNGVRMQDTDELDTTINVNSRERDEVYNGFEGRHDGDDHASEPSKQY